MTCEHLNELIMQELGEAELDDDVIVVGDVMCDECEREYYVVLTIDILFPNRFKNKLRGNK
tara:strand:- start:161 stop:343 length:183 start_codon:yes stop_codon:yes gene_type:complete